MKFIRLASALLKISHRMVVLVVALQNSFPRIHHSEGSSDPVAFL